MALKLVTCGVYLLTSDLVRPWARVQVESGCIGRRPGL